jgi:hypothetical protein
MAITREKSTRGRGRVLLRRPFPKMEREGEDCGRREMTCGVHLSASGGEDAGTLSGWRVAGPRAESGARPKGFPGSIFIFISSILFFPFLISDLKKILCNLDSKHFKQNPKLF